MLKKFIIFSSEMQKAYTSVRYIISSWNVFAVGFMRLFFNSNGKRYNFNILLSQCFTVQ